MIAGLRLLEVALPLLALTSAPDSAWAISHGKAEDDILTSVAENYNHEIILAGESFSCSDGVKNGLLFKLDQTGNLLWSRCCGTKEESGLVWVDIAENNDILLCGFTRSEGEGPRDGWIMRFDDFGNEKFSKTFGGTESDVMKFILPMTENEFYTCGNTRSFGEGDADFWFSKFDREGNRLWSRTYGGVYYEDSHWIVPVSTGGFLLVGHTSSFGEGPYNGWVVRTDAAGDSLWSRIYLGQSVDMLYSGVETADGGFLLAGHTDSKGSGNLDFWLIKTDKNGYVLWDRVFGGPGDECCYSMQLCSDGGILLFGETYSFGSGSSDFWLLRTSSKGDSLWSKTYGGNDSDRGLSIVERAGGGYLLGGSTVSYGFAKTDFWLVQIERDSLVSELVTSKND